MDEIDLGGYVTSVFFFLTRLISAVSFHMTARPVAGEMKFPEFLDKLSQNDGERRHFTTQYSTDPEGGPADGDDGGEEGGITTYPSPTNALETTSCQRRIKPGTLFCNG